MTRKKIIIFSLIFSSFLLLGLFIGLKANFPILQKTPYPTVGDYLDLENLDNNNIGNCHIPVKCKNLVVVECDWAGDPPHGPYYYVKAESGEIISDCHRFCITDTKNSISFTCPNCPPEEWTCHQPRLIPELFKKLKYELSWL